MPAHLKGGFRASGIYPLSRKAIPDSKLATSIPFRDTSDASVETEQQQKSPKVSHQLSCKGCGKPVTPAKSLTPMKFQIVGYLTRYIEAKPKPRSNDKRRVKVKVYGEVLTCDDVIERLEEEEAEKAEKVAQKAKKAAEKAEKAAEKAEKAAEKAKKAAEKAEKAAGREERERRKPQKRRDRRRR